ncbi:MAG: AP2 domain-containing protein [Chloroflexota bacterium]|nr:AP2 domain-containing protein [Chloroflexota bacterium]
MASEETEAVLRIPLTRGKYALVDAEDFPRLAAYRWHAFHDRKDGRWLAVRGERIRIEGRSVNRNVWMHREILGAPDGMPVEHLNDDGLDNRKANLQRSTRAERYAKRGKLSTNTSGYCGVTFYARTGKWRAQIRCDGTTLHLGYFTTAEEAAVAYDRKARAVFGAFAYQNFPEVEPLLAQGETNGDQC